MVEESVGEIQNTKLWPEIALGGLSGLTNYLQNRHKSRAQAIQARYRNAMNTLILDSMEKAVQNISEHHIRNRRQMTRKAIQDIMQGNQESIRTAGDLSIRSSQQHQSSLGRLEVSREQARRQERIRYTLKDQLASSRVAQIAGSMRSTTDQLARQSGYQFSSTTQPGYSFADTLLDIGATAIDKLEEAIPEKNRGDPDSPTIHGYGYLADLLF